MNRKLRLFRSLLVICAVFSLLGAVFVVNSGGVRGAATRIGLTTEITHFRGGSSGVFIQRRSDGSAKAEFMGTVGFLADRVEFAGVLPGEALSAENWAALDDSPSRTFRGFAELGPGYSRLFLRSVGRRGSRTFPAQDIYVGDIFIVAGQSNAAGSSQTYFTPKSQLVRRAQVMDGRIIKWIPGADPQIGNGGGSVWPRVGDELVEALGGVPIGFVNCAVGSTSIRDWQPGMPSFENLDSLVQELGPGGVRAILWHQGEADQSMAAEDYAEKLANIIGSLRTEAGWEVPWVVATASFESGRTSSAVRSGQASVVESGLAYPGPDTDVLTGDHREADGVHFNKAGTQAAAGLWVNALLNTIYAEANASLEN